MWEVQIKRQGHAGRITLNRPQALNALTFPMVQEISATLARWQDDPAVALVIIDGAGRGLCAGGDIRVLYEAARVGDMDIPYEFFSAEYKLNARIAHFSKPYIAMMDGVVMGGGVGLSAHGSVRIVTERTMLAMPETGIGLFPDVGATWLLSRDLPRGLHLALTGARVGAADAIAAGLADWFVPSTKLSDLVNALSMCADRDGVLACVTAYAETTPEAAISAAWLQKHYDFATVEEIAEALAASDEPQAQAASIEIASKSPSSLKVTLRALRAAAHMHSLDEALRQELVLAMACMQSFDFVEGVRAAVIDKDRKPVWQPATLAEVSDEMVAAYF